ncbi:hypothetical protein TMatcc_009832, partial [Talaromyces marneffei ATCC 18224]
AALIGRQKGKVAGGDPRLKAGGAPRGFLFSYYSRSTNYLLLTQTLKPYEIHSQTLLNTIYSSTKTWISKARQRNAAELSPRLITRQKVKLRQNFDRNAIYNSVSSSSTIKS